MDYQKAKETLATAKSPSAGKPLQNNTRLFQRGEGFAIRLHQTDVVTIHPDDTYTLDSGGWQTVTTKARMNDYIPRGVTIGSDRGIWYLMVQERRNGDEYPRWHKLTIFEDGIRIDSSGRPVSAPGIDPVEYEAARERVNKLVRNYIRGYIRAFKAGKVEFPNSGDCWGCSMVPQGKSDDKRALADPKTNVMGLDHYLSHFEEKYYVPSILWRALQRRGDPAFVWEWATRNPRIADSLAMDLRAYFSKIKPQLAELLMAQGQAGD